MKLSDEKKELIKDIIKLNKGKRNLNSKILKVIKDEIENWLNKGLGIVDIQILLKRELKRDFEYKALAAWIKRNIKDKSKSNKGVENVETKKLNKKEKNDSSDKSITKNDENNGNPFAFLKK